MLSSLSGKRVRIRNIRSKDDSPGVRGESRLRPACGVAVSAAANVLAVTQLGVFLLITGRSRGRTIGRQCVKCEMSDVYIAVQSYVSCLYDEGLVLA